MFYFFFLMIRRPPRSTLFPYTTALPILTSRLSLCKHLAHNLGNLLLLGKIGVFKQQQRSEERFSRNAETDLVCRLLLEKKKKNTQKGETERTAEERRLRAILGQKSSEYKKTSLWLH